MHERGGERDLLDLCDVCSYGFGDPVGDVAGGEQCVWVAEYDDGERDGDVMRVAAR